MFLVVNSVIFGEKKVVVCFFFEKMLKLCFSFLCIYFLYGFCCLRSLQLGYI